MDGQGGGPGGPRYLEDFVEGQTFADSPTIEVTAEMIKAFAREFDPQPYHLDEAAAEYSALRGLAASGWHTAALTMRLIVDSGVFGTTPILGLGVDELRWPQPVRPGDILSLRTEVIEARPSRSKPDQGIVRFHITAVNQRAEPVYSIKTINLMPRRPSAVA